MSSCFVVISKKQTYTIYYELLESGNALPKVI